MALSVIRMLSLRSSILAILLLAFASAAPAASGWFTDWNSAASAAKRRMRPLIVLVEHEGCPDCARMSQSLEASAAQDALACAVKVRLEFQRNPDVIYRYGISLTPTFLIFSPEGGELSEVYREVGSMSVNRIVQVGRSVDALATRLAALQPPPEPPAEEEKPEKAEKAEKAAKPEQPEKKPAASAPTEVADQESTTTAVASSGTGKEDPLSRRSSTRKVSSKRKSRPTKSKPARPAPTRYRAPKPSYQESRPRLWPFW